MPGKSLPHAFASDDRLRCPWQSVTLSLGSPSISLSKGAWGGRSRHRETSETGGLSGNLQSINPTRAYRAPVLNPWRFIPMTDRTYQDILFTKRNGIATVTINRPQVYNAFRPQTIDELMTAFEDAWYDESVGVIVLTGAKGNFCTGGDQKIRGDQGYVDDRTHEGRL